MILEIDAIDVSYGRVRALEGVTANIMEGSIVAVLGANGAGKSTLLKSIIGLAQPQKGAITFMGERTDGKPTERIVKKGIAMVPEGRQIFPMLTVMENLNMGRYSRNDNAQVKLDLEYVFTLFPIIKERMKQLGGTLSGGQQQMLAIARGLMSNPKLLLLDEPSLGLAPIVISDIFRAIKEINENGTTILLVEQNASMALRAADYAYVLETGVVSVQGSSTDLQNNDDVRRTYLGG